MLPMTLFSSPISSAFSRRHQTDRPGGHQIGHGTEEAEERHLPGVTKIAVKTRTATHLLHVSHRRRHQNAMTTMGAIHPSMELLKQRQPDWKNILIVGFGVEAIASHRKSQAVRLNVDCRNGVTHVLQGTSEQNAVCNNEITLVPIVGNLS